MYMKELQACSYLVSLNYGTLLNCAHYYSTVIYIKINKAVVMFFTGHDYQYVNSL